MLSSDQLIELAWDDPSGLAPSRVKYAVLRLRRKLGLGRRRRLPPRDGPGLRLPLPLRGAGERAAPDPHPTQPGVANRRCPAPPCPSASPAPCRVRLPVFALVAVGTVLIARHPVPPRRPPRDLRCRRPLLRPGRRRLPRARGSACPTGPGSSSPSATSPSSPSSGTPRAAPTRGWSSCTCCPSCGSRSTGGGSTCSSGSSAWTWPSWCRSSSSGPPKYPTLEWRQVAVMATVTTLVASTVYTMVSRDRAFLERPRPAVAHRAAQRPRGRLRPRPPRDPAPRRHRQRHHGRRPGGHRDLLLRRRRADARLPGRRGRRASAPSPTSSTRPRSTSGARPSTPCAPTLEPVDAETAAEVPWTATRKDGQQRRCVVRVRALPVPDARRRARRGRADEAKSSTTTATTAGPDRRRARRDRCRPGQRRLRRRRDRRDRA